MNATDTIKEALREYDGYGDGADRQVLAEYTREIQAQALRDAADELERQMREAGEGGSVDNGRSIHRRVLNFLRYRAASLKSMAARLTGTTERES